MEILRRETEMSLFALVLWLSMTAAAKNVADTIWQQGWVVLAERLPPVKTTLLKSDG